jgi:hypothetical protein
MDINGIELVSENIVVGYGESEKRSDTGNRNGLHFPLAE